MSAVLFGKLPAHGDFVTRGLSNAARGAIDDWLSGSLADARDTYGDAFENLFARALPWRCVGRGAAGAIAASQDAVGRAFPLFILAAGDDDRSRELEELLYSAIVERWDADRVIEAAGPPPTGDVDRWFGQDREIEGAMPPRLLRAMLA